MMKKKEDLPNKSKGSERWLKIKRSMAVMPTAFMNLWPLIFSGIALWLLWQVSLELAGINRSYIQVRSATFDETLISPVSESVEDLSSEIEALANKLEEAACISAKGSWRSLEIAGSSTGYCSHEPAGRDTKLLELKIGALAAEIGLLASRIEGQTCR